MKKFIMMGLACIILYLIGDYLYYDTNLYSFRTEQEVTSQTKTIGKTIYLEQEGQFEPFEIKGVNMGVGIPGHYATEYAISKETYMRWFKYIQEMGANTIRVYTILADAFYEAVYEYNKENEQPLYILHGLWVNDYVQNSHKDAYDKDFLDVFIEDGKDLIDVIHGRKKLALGSGRENERYKRDISPWVIGYILGVEWEDVTVAYTDHMQVENNHYVGDYMYTTEDATPFEAMLAQVGDTMIAYETKRYGTQRLMAFSNWPTTDPLEYGEEVLKRFDKIAKVDVEHIQMTEAFRGGTFASYHVYPYFPDYLEYEEDTTLYKDQTGQMNTYQAYLKKINDHHTMPVIISEFGIPTSRGMASKDINTGRNQGNMSEDDQAEALVTCYEDIKAAGCAGSVVFIWQDEWFKRTWNTMHGVNLQHTAYWSDYQTNEQYFGLLSFDPGKEQSICYVDGDIAEWSVADRVFETKDLALSMKYDEKFIYLLAYKKGFKEDEKLYIPIDTTPQSGSRYEERSGLKFDRAADFVLEIDGRANSRVWVQERYEVLRAIYAEETEGINAYETPPAPDSSVFKPIQLILQNREAQEVTYETGLLTYGNANPYEEGYNSLADFCFSGDYVEIKLPWQLLNFSNPSKMMIHDDYYKHYGVEEIPIKKMYVGIGTASQETPITLKAFNLKGWSNKPTYHERLKPAYFAMQELWREEDE
ncbi:MAG: hypothetical protein RR627_02545 [Niameybacter sp.]